MFASDTKAADTIQIRWVRFSGGSSEIDTRVVSFHLRYLSSFGMDVYFRVDWRLGTVAEDYS